LTEPEQDRGKLNLFSARYNFEGTLAVTAEVGLHVASSSQNLKVFTKWRFAPKTGRKSEEYLPISCEIVIFSGNNTAEFENL